MDRSRVDYRDGFISCLDSHSEQNKQIILDSSSCLSWQLVFRALDQYGPGVIFTKTNKQKKNIG